MMFFAFIFLFAAPEASALVDHTALACIPAERYARVAGRGAQAASAQLQFRTSPSGPWYSTRMTAAEGEWSAFLPRPARTLAEVEYRIVATGAGAEKTESAPVRARVGAPGECDEAGRTSVDAPIVVTVPAGAPLVPPVPAGFSPAGVVAAEPPKRSNLALKIAGGVAAAAVIGVTAAATAESTSEQPSTLPIVPPISFNNTQPRPGASFNYNRDPFVVEMRLGARPNVTLTLFWRVELRAADGRVCLEMNGVATAPPDSVDVALTGPLINNGACGFQFDTQSVHIGISHQNQQVYEETLGMPYHLQS
jgi:hypothetical protein